MRFLLDECIGPVVARRLQNLQHDVVSVYDTDRGIDDQQVLQKAVSENRILVTNDKDFGEIIIRRRKSHRGVILLRLEDERSANKIAVLTRLLEQHAEELPGAFVVVSDTGVRITRRK